MSSVVTGGSDCVGTEARLRRVIDELANQLCVAVDGKFDFTAKVDSDDETFQKLQMLVNFVLDAARRSLSERNDKIRELQFSARALAEINRDLKQEIAERERVDEQLRLREAKLRAILNSTLDPTLTVDSAGIIQDVSHSVEQVFGWSPAELVGRNVSVLAPEPHRSRHDQYVANFRQTGESEIVGRTREMVAVRKDGSLVPCELTIWQVDVPGSELPMFTGIIRDITERKRISEEVRSLARFADENPNPVIRVSREGVLLYANASSAPLLETWQCSIGGGLPTGVRQVVDVALCSGSNEYIDAACADRYYSLSIAPVVESGYVNLYGQDITDRVQIEKAHKEAKEAAEAADRSKSEFLANMSHEIRTPMTAILGFADVLAGRVTDPEESDAVRTIKRNGEHLLEIINGILDLSKIEAGRLHLENVACSPSNIIAEVASLMRVRVDAKGLALTVGYDGPIPETIQTDPTRLRQILINLLGNAIKFTEVGRVSLVTRLLDKPGMPSTLQFSVSDTGIGMDKDQLDRLFQPFAQADTSTTRKFGGTGLGLTISRRLASTLGGDITADCKPGAGCTFHLTIATGSLERVHMFEEAAETELRSENPRQTEQNEPQKLDCRILLAEDGPDNQRLISYVLKKAGADVTVADNGSIAVDKINESAAGGAPFDVVLMDMQMPVLDGYEATRQLRQEGHHVPIIALTAHAMASDRQKCLDAGCDDYATKPINRRQLLTLIHSWANAPRAHHTSNSTP